LLVDAEFDRDGGFDSLILSHGTAEEIKRIIAEYRAGIPAGGGGDESGL